MVSRVPTLDANSKIPDRFLPDRYGGSAPVGTIIEFAGTGTPTDHLVCDGTAVSRTAYPELFAVIGTIYGVGDGSTTFNLPNKKGRVGVGLDPADANFMPIGNSGGAKTVTLDSTQIPPHTHPVGHGGQDAFVYPGGPMGGTFNINVDIVNTSSGSYAMTAGAQSGTTGAAHSNLQPYLVVNYAIKFRLGMQAGQFTNRMVGEVSQWAGVTPPAGYLACDGAAVSRTGYPELFAAIGTAYGAGDGSTTFNLPNSPVGEMVSAAGTTAQTGTVSTDLTYTGVTLTVPPGTWELFGMVVGMSSVGDAQTACLVDVGTSVLVPGSRGGAALVGASPDFVEHNTRPVVVTLAVTTQYRLVLSRNGSSVPSIPASAGLASGTSGWINAKRLPYDVTKSIINASPVPMLSTLPQGTNGWRRIGEMFAWGGAGIPQDTLECNGQLVSRTAFAELFAAIGTVHGVGDGSTTFALPDLRGRVVAGYDATQTEFNAIGKTGGEKTHLLTITEMPSHTHVQNAHTHIQDAHSHAYNVNSANAQFSVSGGTGMDLRTTQQTGTTVAVNQNTTATNQNTGGGAAHNVLQPYVALKWVIKVIWTATEVTVNAAHTHRVMDLSGIAHGTAAASGGSDGDLYLKHS